MEEVRDEKRQERECTGKGQMEGLETELHAFAFRLISITHVNIRGWRDAVRIVYARSNVITSGITLLRQLNTLERCRSVLPFASKLFPQATSLLCVLSVCCPKRFPMAAEVGTGV